MSDIYSRVYYLPQRLTATREKIASMRSALADPHVEAKARRRAAIARQQARLTALENEARRFGFTDLLESGAA